MYVTTDSVFNLVLPDKRVYLQEEGHIDEDGCITEKHRTVGSELSGGIDPMCRIDLWTRGVSTHIDRYVAAIFGKGDRPRVRPWLQSR